VLPHDGKIKFIITTENKLRVVSSLVDSARENVRGELSGENNVHGSPRDTSNRLSLINCW